MSSFFLDQCKVMWVTFLWLMTLNTSADKLNYDFEKIND